MMKERDIRSSLFVVVAVLLAVGVVMIYSASAIYAGEKMGDNFFYLKRHLIYLVLGIAMMLGVMAVDMQKLRRFSKPLIFFSALMLLLVLVPHLGREAGGARRWFKLGPLNFQPSEFAKFAVIIYIADFAARRKNVMKSFWQGYVPPMMVIGGIAVLVLAEPDLGTAIAVVAIGLLMLFASGVSILHIAASLLAGLPALYALIFSAPYRKKRMLAFLNPWADKRGVGFQIIQSFVALGSGGLFGVGLGQSRQKLFYLPASHTDFIFSIIGEELGFFGAACVVVLFMIFVWQGMRIAFSAEDDFLRFLCFGIVSLIAFEAIVNIGVVSGLLPTKGLPLPFISYGGTALVFHLMAVGVILNVAKTSEVIRR
ncbi:MAG: putative lipid II flippase FtsW [Candidatus Omnitrophica bacterium]|nr:putative lipid II flippase FtsW [Candidatus Omnitrophota bacterium]